MALFDHRGRLFGRINLLDLAVACLMGLLVLLAYASWRLFQTPAPVIESISPAVVQPGQPDQTLAIQGQHLRPYLLANIGTARAVFLFESPDRAEVKLPALAPGTYDLAFFDSKEIARVANAVTVREPIFAEVRVRFVTRPEIIEAIRQAQREQPQAAAPATTPSAQLVSFEVTDELLGTTKPDLEEGRLSVIRALVRVPATRTGSGWEAEGITLKAGAPFTLNAPTYYLRGEILNIEAPSDKH